MIEGLLDGDAEGELGDAEDEDILVSHAPADELGLVLGTLEDVMMDDGFNERIDAFMREHCEAFGAEGEGGEASESSHAQYALFMQFTELLERYILAKMRGAFGEGFDMGALCALIKEHGADAINIDLEALGAYGDFEAFKTMMGDYRREARLEGDPAALALTGSALRLWQDDEEDGLPMPELTLTISSPVRPAAGMARMPPLRAAPGAS